MIWSLGVNASLPLFSGGSRFSAVRKARNELQKLRFEAGAARENLALKKGGNLIDLGDAVRAKIQSLESRYPIGIEFEYVTFQPAIVEKKVSDFASNLIQAVAKLVPGAQSQ